ncbi:hypothetical protein KFK09_000509 [Dendrobium nobile]|uniref:Uncharacterized protein n=1 Tax=Dendrobium nobile TaxID=94219 RepID=A0A8T3CF15_DENNO|nr:hypothetical protein KFK09_000509 [Dendrobium nobile]
MIKSKKVLRSVARLACETCLLILERQASDHSGLVRKKVLGREPTHVELHSHTHKRQEDQQWADKRVRKAYEEYTRLRESQATAREGSSAGSVEYSDYRTWQQAVGGMFPAELSPVGLPN